MISNFFGVKGPCTQGNSFVTLDQKPISVRDYNVLQEAPHPLEEHLALIVQGPLLHAHDFTLESVQLYRQTFPVSPIIVSTWDNEPPEALSAIRAAGAHVVTSRMPTTPCFCYMNHQAISTRAGIALAKKLGSRYVLKTRADQRYYETGIPRFLLEALSAFPLPKHISGQKSRLISLGINTFKYRLYDISDMFLFGHIEDVESFWNCPLETRPVFPSFSTLREYCRLRPSEIFFTTDWLERVGHVPTYTLEDSWRIYGERFCILDEHSFGFYWPKYSPAIFRWRNFFGLNRELEELTFKEWLALFFGRKPEDWQENLLDGGPLPSLRSRNDHSAFFKISMLAVNLIPKRTFRHKIRRRLKRGWNNIF